MIQDELQVILIQVYLVEKGYIAIEANSPFKIGVEFDGKIYELVGRISKLVPPDVKIVSLFSPNGFGLAVDMEERFLKAAHEHVKGGKKFGTSLRRSIEAPIIVWE